MTDIQALIANLYTTLGLALDHIEQEPTTTPPTISDGITLGAGSHTLDIETPKQPTKVFVSLDEGDHQVCGADLSSVSTTINPTGFLVYLDIKSDHATVSWVVTH